MNVIKLRRTFRDIIQLLVTTTAAAQSYTIPADTGTFTPTVDWGDGTVQVMTGTADPNKTHTYAAAGAYTITIRGTAQSLRTFASVSSPFLTKILQVRSKSLTDFSFFNSSTLNELPTSIIAPNLVGCVNMFFLCPLLTTIPPALLTYAPSITDLRSAFQNTGVTSVPSTLLTNQTGLTQCDSMFQNTAAMTTAIPNGLISTCTALTKAPGMFFSSGVPSLPSSTFFSTNTLLTDISAFFYANPTMTGTPVGTMFNTNTALTTISNIFGFTAISGAVPLGLFANQSLVTTAVGTFLGCPGITSIPANLFSNMPLITNFNNVLKGTSISSISAGQFASNPLVTNFANALEATPLTSINAATFSVHTAVLSYANLLYQCTSLPLVPPTIFNASTLNRNYSFSFTENGGMTAADIDALLIQIDTVNVATGAGLTFDYAFGNPVLSPTGDAFRSAPALTAITNLLARGWTRSLVY